MSSIQFQLRPATHSDLQEIAALLSEGLSFDGLVFVQTAEELAEEFDGTYCDLDHDVMVAEHESRIIGVGYTIFLPSETKEERCYIFGTTKPEYRNNGVGTAVMQWATEHGETLLRSTKRTLPKYLRSDMSATNSTAGSLFQSFNMSPVRWNDDLIIDLANSPEVFTATEYSDGKFLASVVNSCNTNLQSVTFLLYVANDAEISDISNFTILLAFNNVSPSVPKRFPISNTSSNPVLYVGYDSYNVVSFSA
jgi:N-acetylglutamate synthase-like GNAT family acetyltransferase